MSLLLLKEGVFSRGVIPSGEFFQGVGGCFRRPVGYWSGISGRVTVFRNYTLSSWVYTMRLEDNGNYTMIINKMHIVPFLPAHFRVVEVVWAKIQTDRGSAYSVTMYTGYPGSWQCYSFKYPVLRFKSPTKLMMYSYEKNCLDVTDMNITTYGDMLGFRGTTLTCRSVYCTGHAALYPRTHDIQFRMRLAQTKIFLRLKLRMRYNPVIQRIIRLFGPNIFPSDIFTQDVFKAKIYTHGIFNPVISSRDIFTADNSTQDIFTLVISTKDIFSPDIYTFLPLTFIHKTFSFLWFLQRTFLPITLSTLRRRIS